MTAITHRRVIVSHEAPSGDLTMALGAGVPHLAVALTPEWLAPRGGVSYVIGQDWAIRLGCVYTPETGSEDGIDFTSDVLTVTVWDALTGTVIDTHTSSSPPATNAILIKDQTTARASGGTRGDLVLQIAAAHAPTAGRHRFELVRTENVAGTSELVAAGWIDYGAAVPA